MISEKITYDCKNFFHKPSQRALLYKKWENMCAKLGYQYFAQQWHDLRVILIADYAITKRIKRWSCLEATCQSPALHAVAHAERHRNMS
jgi:hypothetical protein